MNRVIEADFLPRETDVEFSWPSSPATSDATTKRRIPIVGDDKNLSHLVNVLLEKTGSYLVFEEYDVINAHQSARKFRPDLILLDVINADQRRR